jgi:hypothetical protein
MKTALEDRTGERFRLMGLGALLALAAAGGVLSGESPKAVAATGAEAGAEPADPLDLRRADRFPQQFGGYPGAVLTPMGRLSANGNPMEMHFFRTPDAAAEVLRYYARKFRSTNHHVDFQGDEHNGMVSYYDETVGDLVAVHALTVPGTEPGKDPGSQTLAFPSIAQVPEGVRISGQGAPGLPRLENSVVVGRVEDLNAGRAAGSQSVTEIAHGKPSEVLANYTREMKSRGFRVAASSEQAVDFEGQGQRVSVLASLMPGAAEETMLFVQAEVVR